LAKLWKTFKSSKVPNFFVKIGDRNRLSCVSPALMHALAQHQPISFDEANAHSPRHATCNAKRGGTIKSPQIPHCTKIYPHGVGIVFASL
jgi:hypothetical protein